MPITEFQLSIGNGTYSGRMAVPESPPTDTPVIVALHGGTYFSKYFDIEGHSLLELALARNVAIIALDRPGYAASTPLADAPDLLHQNALQLHEVVPAVVAELAPGASGVFLIGHSMGGLIAITIAGQQPDWLLGIAVSGIGTVVPEGLGDTFAQLPLEALVTLPVEMKDAVMFGPADTMDATMPEASHAADTTVPLSELMDVVSGWVERFPAIAAQVSVPVHYRQAEFDHLWVTDEGTVGDFGRAFTGSARVDARITPGAGHCIDFHNVSMQFQTEQLEFAATCQAR
jgi:pimeloyl-ACP methyl ester carboxylesterase